MKATSNQILLAASNILGGFMANCDIDQSKIKDYIDLSIMAAKTIAENIEDDQDYLENTDELKTVIQEAFASNGGGEMNATLLAETIRAHNHLNRNLATAYVQQAARLGFIKAYSPKGSKRVIYTLSAVEDQKEDLNDPF